MEKKESLIKVINNFITKDEAFRIIDFIDKNLDKSMVYQENRRYAWRFGKDFYWEDSIEDFTKVGGIEQYFREIVFKKTISALESLYHAKDISVSNLWFSKHYPGSIIPLHLDIDQGHNPQFKYSAIIYLNSLNDTGILKFPFSNFNYTPKEGDLVLFPSDGKEFAHQVDEINEIRYTVPMWISSSEYSL